MSSYGVRNAKHCPPDRHACETVSKSGPSDASAVGINYPPSPGKVFDGTTNVTATDMFTVRSGVPMPPSNDWH